MYSHVTLHVKYDNCYSSSTEAYSFFITFITSEEIFEGISELKVPFQFLKWIDFVGIHFVFVAFIYIHSYKKRSGTNKSGDLGGQMNCEQLDSRTSRFNVSNWDSKKLLIMLKQRPLGFGYLQWCKCKKTFLVILLILDLLLISHY